jgi:hypothetical protein
MAAKKVGSRLPKGVSTADVAKVFGIVRKGKDRQSIKKELLTEFGSLDIPVATFLCLRKTAASDLQISHQAQELGTRGDRLWREIFNDLVDELKNIERWDQAAARSKEALQKEVEVVLGTVRKTLYSRYGIEAHRPVENQNRNEWILRMRLIKGLSFGQIALHHNRRDPDAKITPNVAGLAYKRACDECVESMIRMLRPDLERASPPGIAENDACHDE